MGGLPQPGNCFALLACMHARTHTAQYGRFGFVNLSGLSVRLSSAFSVLRVFSVFLNLLVDTLCLFYECLEDFAKLAIWKAWDRDLHMFS